mmetsp:Transcript_5253/g.15525  ORF Transcript_5253/g.15525 Transcript_5253/m.15525 type:complete len:213 (+) Transcript_5253:97-735(+)
MPLRSQPQLLDGILAGGKLSRNDSHRRKHGETPVVELPVSRVHVVHVNAQGVAEVAGLPILVLRPQAQLQEEQTHCEHAEAVDRRRAERDLGLAREVALGGLEPREPGIVLHDTAHSGHHGNSTVLELRCAQFPKTLAIANLGEPKWVEKSKRCCHPHLVLRFIWLGRWQFDVEVNVQRQVLLILYAGLRRSFFGCGSATCQFGLPPRRRAG